MVGPRRRASTGAPRLATPSQRICRRLPGRGLDGEGIRLTHLPRRPPPLPPALPARLPFLPVQPARLLAARRKCRVRPGDHPRPSALPRRGRDSPRSRLRCPGRARVLVFPFVAVVLSIAAGPAVLVMHYAVLSQQKVSRELPAVRCSVRGRGTHLRKQVQGSVAHGTSGGGSLPGSASRPRLFRGVTR